MTTLRTIFLVLLLTSLPAGANTYVIDALLASNAAEAEEMYQKVILEHAAKGGLPARIKLLLSGDVGFDPGKIRIPYGMSHIVTDVYIYGPITRNVTFTINVLEVNKGYPINLYSEINLR